MKKLNITKEAFEKSRYFTNKYGKLEYVSESGKVFKTNKGKILMFKESNDMGHITCLASCENWNEDQIRTFNSMKSCKQWIERNGNFIARKCNGKAIWVEDDEFIVISQNGNKVADFKMVQGKMLKESFDDMEKEFTYKGISITRYDYESLPSPMAASKLDDKTMQRIAYDIYDYLSSAGWEDDEIAKYLGSNLDDVLDDDWKGEQIKSEFWQYMEKAALDNGMEYYEDMPEEEM